MVRTVNVGSVPKKRIYEKKYVELRGVDFSTDPALVDNAHSPWCPNMISDAGGHPEKRRGWRVVEKYKQRINGIHDYYGTLLIHSGTSIWESTNGLPGFDLEKITGINDDRSESFLFNNRLYILTGKEYLSYDGSSLSAVVGFVPTTHIGMTPATGAGTFYEDINMLTGKRTNSFTVPSDGATVFFLDSAGIDSDAVTVLANNQVLVEGTDFTVNRTTGAVTFGTSIPGSNGIDTVFITFSKTVSGARDNIDKCTLCAMFGMGNDSRVFLSGNPDFPNYDYASYLYDPTYFPASGWTKIGSDASPIMGYIRQYQNLVIVKEDNVNQEASIYLRSAELTADGEAIFPIQQGAAGVGAVSKYCFSYLRDDPLFLSRDGVSALTLAYGASQQRNVQNRSSHINARLTKMDLENAVSCVWNGYYLISVRGTYYDPSTTEIFLADSRQKSGTNNAINNESFDYEWYHWNNVPARVLFSRGDDLYFGTDEGNFCIFKKDDEATNPYSDDVSLGSTVGAPIIASWMTRADDDGDFMVRKTMPKRGTGAMFKPYPRSSVKVYAVADVNGNPEYREIISETTLDIFDFNDIDFTRFSFRTSSAPAIVAFDTKIKKYSTLYFVLENDQVNEGFGIYGIIKRFVHGNYLKRGF